MNWDEFTAWRSSYSFLDNAAPTQRQLDRLRGRLSSVVLDAKPMSEQTFLDQYWSPYQKVEDGDTVVDRPLPWTDWNSITAFTALGKLDRQTIK